MWEQLSVLGLCGQDLDKRVDWIAGPGAQKKDGVVKQGQSAAAIDTGPRAARSAACP